MLTDHGRLSKKLGHKGEAGTIGKQDKNYTENYHWHCLFVSSFFLSFFLSVYISLLIDLIELLV
jgi:hypothetical protein